MREKKKLQKMGIREIEKLKNEEKDTLSKAIATKLSLNISENIIKYEKIYNKLIKTKMYKANISIDLPKANYMYFNSALYFDKTINLEEINENILHECIHKIQEYKAKGRVLELGTCHLKDMKLEGFAFNEAAISYIVNKCLNEKKHKIEEYEMIINSSSKNYLLITNLVEQIIFFTEDEDMMIDSTLNSNSDWIYKLYDAFGKGNIDKIRKNFDDILQYVIKDNQNEARELYLKTQKMIYTAYFEQLIRDINQLNEVEEFKQKLEEYKKIMTQYKNENYYEEYANILFNKIEQVAEKIKSKNGLMVISNNRFAKWIIKIKRFASKEQVG